MAGKRQAMCACKGIPELDSGITPAAGDSVSIRVEGEAFDIVGEPVCPEQGAALDVPQFEAPIPAPSGQRATIRAEGEGVHRVGMPLPGQVQTSPFLAPHAYFPT